MKANWKLALMGIAALAFVACNHKNGPDEGGDEETFVSKISVKDNSIADWDKVPAEYLVTSVCPDDAALLGLKSIKVYADYLYINLLVEYDSETILDLSWVPFHVYINTDNSDLTGGYADEFADANTDILLETAVFADDAPCSYNPAVFKWWGEVGGAGWEWTDPEVEATSENGWGAIVAEGAMPIGSSQVVDGKIEIQLMRALIPCKDFAPWADEFGIGFDIQQDWSSVGVLPCVSATDENPNGLANKLQVKIDKTL